MLLLLLAAAVARCMRRPPQSRSRGERHERPVPAPAGCVRAVCACGAGSTCNHRPRSADGGDGAARDERLRLEHVALGGGDEAEHRKRTEGYAYGGDSSKSRASAVLGCGAGRHAFVYLRQELAQHTEMSAWRGFFLPLPRTGAISLFA